MTRGGSTTWRLPDLDRRGGLNLTLHLPSTRPEDVAAVEAAARRAGVALVRQEEDEGKGGEGERAEGGDGLR